MKKKNALLILAVSLCVVGCNPYGLNENNNRDEDINKVAIEAQTDETVENIEETDSAITKALKEKYNYRDATEFMSSSGQAMMLKLNDEYTYDILNEIDEETGIENIATFTSTLKGNVKYNIKLYEVPVEAEGFLLSNPLRLEDTDNESTNKFIDLICIDNSKSDTALKVMDTNGDEHSVKKYEVKLDLTILGIEGLGLCRETPTYYAIENGDKYIALLITEEILSDIDVQIENEEVADSVSDNSIETTSEAAVIIEENIDEEEAQVELDKHQEEIYSIYSELDERTQNHIKVIKDEFLKKELEDADVHEQRLIDIDKVAYDFINNIMIGRFDQY